MTIIIIRSIGKPDSKFIAVNSNNYRKRQKQTVNLPWCERQAASTYIGLMSLQLLWWEKST